MKMYCKVGVIQFAFRKCMVVLILVWFCTAIHVKASQRNSSQEIFPCSEIKIAQNSVPFRNDELVSKWTFPEFPFSENDWIRLCREYEFLQVPVYSHQTEAIITCWTNWGESNANILKLYHGSPDRGMRLISDGNNNTSNGSVVEYVKDIGYKYKLGSPENLPETFTCLVANSTGMESFVVTQLVRDDEMVYVNSSSADCSLEYYTNFSSGSFYCHASEKMYDKEIRWYYQLSNNKTQQCSLVRVPNESKAQYRNTNGVMVESIRVNFPSIDITGLVCALKRKDTHNWTGGMIPVRVKIPKRPVVRTIEEYTLTYQPGMNLSCLAEGDPLDSAWVTWLQDGKTINYLYDIETSLENLVGSSTLFGISNPGEPTNFTCVFSSQTGNSSASYIVHPRRTNWVFKVLISVGVAIPISAMLNFLILAKWRKAKRKEVGPDENLIELQPLEQMPNDMFERRTRDLRAREPDISKRLQTDYSNLQLLRVGQYGKVYRTTATNAFSCGSVIQSHEVVVKSPIWPISATESKAVYEDFMQEIGILQDLNGEDRHENIVRYLKFDVFNNGSVCELPDALSTYFSYPLQIDAYMTLEYCEPGDLKSYLQKMSCLQLGEPQATPYVGLVPSQLRDFHLMIWAEQAASALAFLAEKLIVHRDIAARNMLLKKRPEAESDSPDNLVLIVSDFGMARKISPASPYYIIDTQVTKPRHIPVWWYAPEALGNNVKYTLKSDVWSFGCLLWEMFTLAQEIPFNNLNLSGHGRLSEKLRSKIRKGCRPSWDVDVVHRIEIPLPLQKLIRENCWKYNPRKRPTFAELHESLVQINRLRPGYVRYGERDAV